MSDTLADLASCLPSEFLTGDVHHKPHRPPYDFASSSSTESESDDDDIPGLTCRFTRSVSLQERPKIPYPVQKKGVFSASPESTLNWTVSGPKQFHSSPATPFLRADEDTWGLIYAAAEQVARMKMKNINDAVFANRGLLGAPRPHGPPFSHHNGNCAIMRNENQVFIRQQQFRDRVTGVANNTGGGRFISGRPVGFGQSAWPTHPLEAQRRQPPGSGFAVKPVPSGSAGVVKKGCAGTGVFLPRSYTNVQPEPFKKPARVTPSSNKNLDHIIAQPQANVYSRQHQVPPLPQHHHLKYDELAEMIMAKRQTAVMLAQQQHTRPEPRLVLPEVVLPQEWTY